MEGARAEPRRRETQPIFMRELLSSASAGASLPQVPEVEGSRVATRESSTELPALDGLLDFEDQSERPVSGSVIESISDAAPLLPSLPEGSAGSLADLKEDRLAGGAGVGDGGGEQPDMGRTDKLEPLGVVKTQMAGVDRLPVDAQEDPEGMSALATQRFRRSLFSDDGATNLWDFAGNAIEEGGAGGEGQIIADRYQTLGDLGVGGMARIVKVRHLNLGKEFALKIIHDDLSSDFQMRKIFIREARVASLMNHPNIVAVTDFGVDPQLGAFIVMEYLKGETLHERLEREQRLRLLLAMDIALQVAEALHYMHQQNIIHCDIKPENIFLSQSPREMRRGVVVKLIDFGLSRREAMGAQLASSEVGGTPDFMAPEQIRGLAPQPSMDIYALGMLLYEMLVGEAAFTGSLQEVISAQLERVPAPPSSRLDEPLDESVDQLVLKALRKDPERRQPSMGQFIFELRTVMDMLGFDSGRRRRRAGPRLKPREHPENSVEVVRTSEAAMVFEHCPCPLFRVDTEPKILVANEAFCRFLGIASPEEAVGQPLDKTRLGLLYPNLRIDVLDAAVNKIALQRLLSFDKAGMAPVQVMIWLVPEVDLSASEMTFAGIITPAS